LARSKGEVMTGVWCGSSVCTGQWGQHRSDVVVLAGASLKGCHSRVDSTPGRMSSRLAGSAPNVGAPSHSTRLRSIWTPP
jgi:hypothetical protein